MHDNSSTITTVTPSLAAQLVQVLKYSSIILQHSRMGYSQPVLGRSSLSHPRATIYAF